MAKFHEVNPNPLVALDATFQDGARLRFVISPPVKQSQFMADIGVLLALWGVALDIQIPEPEGEQNG